jgi:hypothetical protein
VYIARLSSAVCAISGVWLFESMTPLSWMKSLRCGMSSRSEGTLGLSRKKCTLSNVIDTTCSMLLPRSHAGCATALGAAGAMIAINGAAIVSAKRIRPIRIFMAVLPVI